MSEEPKSGNLVHLGQTKLSLAHSTLVSRGLDLAVQLATDAARKQDAAAWRAVVCMGDQRLLDTSCGQLSMYGYITTQASHPEELRGLCKRDKFNLIVTDLDAHVLTAAKQIHHENPTIPVITIRSSDHDGFFRLAFWEWSYDNPLSFFPGGSEIHNIDSGLLKDLVSSCTYHFEDGVCELAEWSRRVLDDAGEWARPYLETVYEEISKRDRNFNQMRCVLYTDALTGAHNRIFFEMRIAEEIERAQHFNGQLSLIMADIDWFKSLNDVFGRDIGNEVLRSVVVIMLRGLRKMDMVCRYSDDDFIIVVPETKGSSALRVAEKLRREIESHDFPGVPRRGKDVAQAVTISCGVADFPTHGITRDGLVSAADAALTVAKSAGRNKVALAPAV